VPATQRFPASDNDTYYLEFTPGTPPASCDGCVAALTERGGFVLRKWLRARERSSPKAWGDHSLIDKRTGLEMLNGEETPFPVFKGRPESQLPGLRSVFLRWEVS